MITDYTPPNTTAGKTKFYQGEGQIVPLLGFQSSMFVARKHSESA